MLAWMKQVIVGVGFVAYFVDAKWQYKR
jgi:hypothetical protein